MQGIVLGVIWIMKDDVYHHGHILHQLDFTNVSFHFQPV